MASSRKDRQARRRRDVAAARYKPQKVELLLVAEAPPAALDRYFYFEHVPDQDSLFRHVVRAVLAIEPSRSAKSDQLRSLADRGVFLIDLKPEPKLPGETLEAYVPDLGHPGDITSATPPDHDQGQRVRFDPEAAVRCGPRRDRSTRPVPG
jgi:hypothetical protein